MFAKLLMTAGAFVGLVIGASFGLIAERDPGLITAVGAVGGALIGSRIAWSIRPYEE